MTPLAGIRARLEAITPEGDSGNAADAWEALEIAEGLLDVAEAAEQVVTSVDDENGDAFFADVEVVRAALARLAAETECPHTTRSDGVVCDECRHVIPHEYVYGGFEVMGDCGKCGHVKDDPLHARLAAETGGEETHG